jgi:hypothetical protein
MRRVVYRYKQAFRDGSIHSAISRHMVALTTYLGHNDARTSYWYLEATPALFSKIAEDCEGFMHGDNP